MNSAPTKEKIIADMERLLDDLERYAAKHPEIEKKVISARAGLMCGVGLVKNAFR